MRLSVLFLILSFLIAQFYSFNYSFETISQPWHDYYWKYNNSNIRYLFGSEIWFPDKMHTSLETFDNSSAVTSSDQQLLGYLNKGQEAKESADYAKRECEKITNLKLLFVYTAITPAFTVYKEIQHSEECIKYGEYWKNSMNGYTNALNYESDLIEKKLEKLGSLQASASYAGLCSEKYLNEQGKSCRQSEQLLEDIETGEDYAGISDLRNDLEAFSVNIQHNVPITAGYWNIIGKAEMALGRLSKLEALLSSDISNSSATARQQISLVKLDQKKAEDAFALATAEDLDRISDAKNIDGVLSDSNEGSVAERFSELGKIKQQADELLSAAGIALTYKQANYLETVDSNSRTASLIYTENEAELYKLLTDAKTVTNNRKSDAASQLNEYELSSKRKIPSGLSEEYYNEAKRLLEQGDSSSTLGGAYVNYAGAEKYARLAKNALDVYDAEDDAEFTSLLRRAEELIAGARSDGLDVYFEEAELSIIKRNNDPAFVSVLEEIINSVIAKARLRYGYLEGERKELRELIALDESLADLFTDMENAEHGAFDLSGKLNFQYAIGRLSEIEEKYGRTRNEIPTSLKNIVSKDLVVATALSVEESELDSPTDIFLVFDIYNPKSYGAENVKAQSRLPQEMSLSLLDATAGRENLNSVYSEGRNLNLLLKNVDSYSFYHIEFSKQAVIAHTLKSQKKTIGNGDGSVSVTEDSDFVLDYDASVRFNAPVSTFLLDGQDTRRKTISAGEHHVQFQYDIADAYSVQKSDYTSSPIGLNSAVQYSLIINPSVDIDRLPLSLSELDASIAKNADAFAVSGEKISEESFTNFGYSFVVNGLKKGKPATVRISYNVDNSSGYAQQRAAFFKALELSGEEEQLLQSAETDISLDLPSKAIEKLEKLGGMVESRRERETNMDNEISKLSSSFEAEKHELKLLKEKSEFEDLPSLSSVSKRISILDAALAANESREEKHELLKSIDKSWETKLISDGKKRLSSEYNQVKKEFLESGHATEAKEFADFDSAMRILDINNDVESLLQAEARFSVLKDFVAKEKNNENAEKEKLKSRFIALKSSAESLAEIYAVQQRDAKGTAYANILQGGDELDRLLSRTEKLLIGAFTFDEAKDSVQQLERKKTSMEADLNLLKKQLDDKILSINSLIKSDGISASQASVLKEVVIKAEQLRSQGRYIQALLELEKGLKTLNAVSSNDESLLLLGLTALLVLGVALIYVVKTQNVEMKFPIFKKEEKVQKVLKRAGD